MTQAVRRNIERFPKDFMFLLRREEIMDLSQFVISSKLKHAPNVYAFTEDWKIKLATRNIKRFPEDFMFQLY